MKSDRGLYPQERQDEILRLVAEQGRVSVMELSRHFGVSGVTIRSDLQTLADLADRSQHGLLDDPVGHGIDVKAGDITADPVGLQDGGAAAHEGVGYLEACEIIGFVEGLFKRFF